MRGQPVSLPLRAELVAGANERYDIGLFDALDGGDAINGQCYRDTLPCTGAELDCFLL